jgi:hypothetical protein
MAFKLKTHSEMVDEVTGVTVVARGFAEIGEKSFGFYDPRSDARSETGDRTFYVIGRSIKGQMPPGGTIAGQIPTIGYRFQRDYVAGALLRYYQKDSEKLEFAINCVREAVLVYMRDHYHVAAPIVEII